MSCLKEVGAVEKEFLGEVKKEVAGASNREGGCRTPEERCEG